MIVIGSNTSDNGQSHFTEDVSQFMELRQKSGEGGRHKSIFGATDAPVLDL